MVDVVVAAKGAITVARAAKLVLNKLNERAPTARLKEAMEIDQRSYEASRDAQVCQRLGALEAQAEDSDAFLEQVKRMLEDGQFRKLHANIEWEAVRDTLAERREMLAHAAAGLSDPALSITDKARIERALRALDPEDIRVLRRLEQAARLPDVHAIRRATKAIVNDAPMAGSTLQSSGCLASDDGTWGADVNVPSPLGLHVLAVLSSWDNGGDLEK